MKSYNWGIIGAGHVAGQFAEDLGLLPRANLYAIASRSDKRARSFAQKYNIPVRYSSWGGIAEDDDVDIVYVATHHPFHHENALACLKAGKAVLCEKPITMNSRELEELVSTARENRVFLMEAIWTRFLPSTRKVLEIKERGELGNLLNVHADFGFRMEFDPKHRLFNPALGGGALLDIGIYPVFISMLMAGSPKTFEASSLNCTLKADSPTEANLLFEKGWIRMESWWLTPGPITVHRTDQEPERIEFPEPGNGYHYEAEEVMRCLDEGLTESASLPLDFSLDLMNTLDKIRDRCGIRYEQDGPLG
jgi:predicted dehydrogenase